MVAWLTNLHILLKLSNWRYSNAYNNAHGSLFRTGNSKVLVTIIFCLGILILCLHFNLMSQPLRKSDNEVMVVCHLPLLSLGLHYFQFGIYIWEELFTIYFNANLFTFGYLITVYIYIRRQLKLTYLNGRLNILFKMI